MPTPRKKQKQTMPSTIAAIPGRLARLRRERGLTQVQLAEAIGISRNLLANYEMGRTHLTDESIILLAQILRVSTDELLGVSRTNTPPDMIPSVRLVRRMQKIQKMPLSDQKALLKTIDKYLSFEIAG
jgi:transcriptional regulator with XRE-family HTH domain